ncbi:hypothetical protein SELMODRAFT_429503 [Selaginella moellendorffii]|uniref:Uncharacterized protein n=1 Tax=Selaginella moellendorffii TaxID=88036 RepID=D8T6E0_SELML|nr:hypothetical protein SELMODRAFT_429503 [Selaginella moellendorffii]
MDGRPHPHGTSVVRKVIGRRHYFDRSYDPVVIRFFSNAKALDFAYEDYTDEIPQIQNSAQSSKKRKFEVHTALKAVYDRKVKKWRITDCVVNEAMPHYIGEEDIVNAVQWTS